MAEHLLFRPEPSPVESLRAYICRIADHNVAHSLFRSMLPSLSTATENLNAVAALTGCDRGALATRLVVTRQSKGRLSEVRLGAITLSRDQVRAMQRVVCPKCLAQEAVAPCYWELRSYDVCHVHGCMLVGACGICKAKLSWEIPSVERCACGIELWQTATSLGSPGRQRLCGVIAAAVNRTIAACCKEETGPPSRGVKLDFLLLMIDFIDKLVLPAFARSTNRILSGDMRRMQHDLIAQMLEDPQYQDYLRDTLFLHAAGEPMTLIEAMRPGKDARELRRYFKPCLSDISFHRCLWQLYTTSEERKSTWVKKKLAEVKKPLRPRDPNALRKIGKQSGQRASDPGGITWRPRSSSAPRNKPSILQRKQ